MHLSETLVILILLVPAILLLIAIVDLLKRDFSKPNDKIVWVLVIVLIPFLGPLLYLLFGKRSGTRSGKTISSY